MISADWEVETVPAAAVKDALEAPPATVTEAGTVSAEVLSEIVTTSPPAGAVAVKVTVQAAEAPDVSVEGLQDRALIKTVGTIVTDADMDFPLVAAVIVTAVLVVMELSVVAEPAAPELAVAGKLAVLAPAATVTLAGTTRATLSSETVMT